MLRLMNLFSLTPKEAQEYSLPVPFFRLGNQYLRYDGFLHIMCPAVGFLTIVIRKHEASWSRTLGSTLAHASDVVAASLPRSEEHTSELQSLRHLVCRLLLE